MSIGKYEVVQQPLHSIENIVIDPFYQDIVKVESADKAVVEEYVKKLGISAKVTVGHRGIKI